MKTHTRSYSPAVEDYLKAIYKLQQNQPAVSTSDLAREMSTSPAAVTKMTKHLSSLDLARYRRYRGVRLSDTGESVALEIIRHHRLLEVYLHRMLGYSWDQVHAEAERLEHHISEEFADRIDEMLKHPRFDPHGEPIPTRDGEVEPARGFPLADAKPGEKLIILRIHDPSPDVLRYLEKIGLSLKSVVVVKDKQPFDGPLTILVEGSTQAVGRRLAGHVIVDHQDK